MTTSTAFAELGYRVEDGDIGYVGTSHASFVERRPPRVAHIRATPTGDAALERIYRLLRDRRAGRGR
ncbi:Uncharacterised protein [Burkholderia pseudomallei]|uniref:hypothetical protein n=1 Tax=Burkholderia pseudomallei TaxID=28450 RepID=UPI000F08198E|nr:hypothetical protein [Burkholderia pseudomallei]VCG82535.1 Uncharacterised protein [Burkholderia pseudomallei]VCH07190.1 Uncharacterised protein [Burkholderia pseudomallei]